MNATTFRYITDALTPDEALKMLKAKEATKKEREEKVREIGSVTLSLLLSPSIYVFTRLFLYARYPAYVTSAGWMGLSPTFRLFISICKD